MSIVQQGALNTTALVVPGVYVQIVPPQNLVLNGVPTNVIGVVGTAQWGPVGQPMIVSTMATYAQTFGAVQNRKYDMGTAVAVAVQQGAQNFRCVRVTDGTDAAATIPLIGTTSVGVIGTALYTGTLGNQMTMQLVAGSKASSWKLIVAIPGMTPEYYDNITGSGATFWSNLVSAVNNGNSPFRGPSNLVVMSLAGSYTTSPAAISPVTLAGGADGVTTLTAAVLVGLDTVPRKGMYALRGQGCSIGVLADADDSTQWTTIDQFGQSEGLYMIQVLPAGTAISAAVTAKASAGLDSYSSKLMHGDWLYWYDQTNAVYRLVSPQGFVAGLLGNLSPEQSSLNKELYSVVGSQKSGFQQAQNTCYSNAELQTLFQVGIDVIGNPAPGGDYWAVLDGHNSSSNQAVNGDNYTRLTNYIAATLNAGMGIYVGQVVNATLFKRIKATLTSFLQNMLNQGQLGSTDGSIPFQVICDTSNNPESRTSLGYVQADAAIQYQAINEKFIINIQGGQTVVIPQIASSLQAAA